MAIVLDPTVGGVSANSYASLAEAATYFTGHAHMEAWDDATDDERNRALVTAARLLDTHVEWAGWPVTETQARAWPRSGLLYTSGYVVSSAVIPTPLKYAQFELAQYLLTTDPSAASDTAGIKRVKAGAIEVEFDGSVTGFEAIPDHVWALIKPWGRVAGHSLSVPVYRT
jgi:hypothetical protein